MSQATFIGVKNESGAAKKLTYGGDLIQFQKDEVKVVDAALGEFLLTRVAYGTEEVPGVGMRVMPKAPFKRIPLHEALKFAKEPENKSLLDAKAEAKREEEIAERVRAQLLKDGWKAPEAGAAVKDEKKGAAKNL